MFVPRRLQELKELVGKDGMTAILATGDKLPLGVIRVRVAEADELQGRNSTSNVFQHSARQRKRMIEVRCMSMRRDYAEWSKKQKPDPAQ